MKQYPVSTVRIGRGETIAYRECGQGETVVLIHGNMSSSVHWQTTMEALEPHCHVLAPDLRGFGDSTYNQLFDSLHDLALDIEAFLDAMGAGRCALVGWSTGGGVAMEIAADRPEQITKLVLLDSVPLTGYPMFKKDASGAPVLGQFYTTKEEIAVDPVQVLPALTAMRTGDRETMRAIWNAVIYNQNQPPQEDYELYLNAILKERCLVDVDYALLTFNISHRHSGSCEGNGRMSLIHCPVYILQGEKDMVVPAAWAQQMKADFGERAEYITFVQAGHSVITDDPELFVKALKGVLGLRTGNGEYGGA